METLNDTEQERLVKAAQEATALVDGGMTPDAAIEKVARANSYGPGTIRTLCYAYNTGRQSAQRLGNENVLDKLASFKLADAEAVIQSIYHGPSVAEKEAAERVHLDYYLPPTWIDEATAQVAAAQPIPSYGVVKQAEVAPQPDPERATYRKLGDIERAKKAADESRRLASVAHDTLRYHVARLTGYFKQAEYDRLPFATVEKAALLYHGDVVKPLFDLIFTQAFPNYSSEKRASDEIPICPTPIDWRVTPFDAIPRCIKLAQDITKHTADQKQHLEKHAQLKEAVLRPFSQAGRGQPPPSSPPSPLCSEKAASIFGTPAGIAVGSLLGQAMSDIPSRNKLVEDAWNDLDDPVHQNEIRKIKAQAMLTGAMSDPDDPIAGAPPDKTLKAFNEIAAMAPRTAEQPAAVLPLIRRRVEGPVETFEAKEVADIEKGLTAARAPQNTNLLNNASQSIFN